MMRASANGMVTAPHALAADAGCAVLRKGGSAAEACVAVGAALAVIYPHMTGIGGDGFWLVRTPEGAVEAIDACGRAAAAANLDLYAGMDDIPRRGPLAANSIAGAISGWDLALERYGSGMPLGRLLRDAIGHAEAGVPVASGCAGLVSAKYDDLKDQPGDWAKIFAPGGRPVRGGELLRQPQLGETLRRLADEGLDGFYRGSLAADIAADLSDLGSPLSASDLAVHRAEATSPLRTAVRGATLYNHSPPTQGIASLLILALFDRLNLPRRVDTFAHVHALIEATKQAFLWRDRYCGDPGFMEADAQALLDDAPALDAMAAAIDPGRALPWPRPSQWGDTCWFGAADARGQVVSCIQSTYFEFGSGVVLPRTGIAWQNRGCSFRLAESGWNALRPGRKPFHTLNPALAMFDDGRVLAYGTMGGEGQPQTQAAIFTRYTAGVDLADAIARPRWLLGRTWGDTSTSLKIEDGFSVKLYAQLAAAGHEVERVGPLTATMGHAGAIVRHGDGRLEGASDPRSDGAAVGW